MNMKIFAWTSLLVSTFFWGWAIKNTLRTQNLDLGVISFFTVMLSSIWILCINRKIENAANSATENSTPPNNIDPTQSNTHNLEQTFSYTNAAPELTRCPIFCVVLSHTLVSFNYLLGAILHLYIFDERKHWLGIYCVVFTFLWFMSAIYGYKAVLVAHEHITLNIVNSQDGGGGFIPTSP